jgi:hypothetical protein
LCTDPFQRASIDCCLRCAHSAARVGCRSSDAEDPWFGPSEICGRRADLPVGG